MPAKGELGVDEGVVGGEDLGETAFTWRTVGACLRAVIIQSRRVMRQLGPRKVGRQEKRWRRVLLAVVRSREEMKSSRYELLVFSVPQVFLTEVPFRSRGALKSPRMMV